MFESRIGVRRGVVPRIRHRRGSELRWCTFVSSEKAEAVYVELITSLLPAWRCDSTDRVTSSASCTSSSHRDVLDLRLYGLHLRLSFQ